MIGIVSPHLFTIEGAPSPNIGDEIIFKYLFKELKSIFKNESYYVFPLHSALNRYHKELLDRSAVIFITGSNFLTPIFASQRKCILSMNKLGIKNKVVFMGAGWSGSEYSEMDLETLNCYETLMHKTYPHSVRDSLSLKKFSRLSMNIMNTACPSMWGLKNLRFDRTGFHENCLFTLTDYNIDIDADSKFLKAMLDRFQRLYFFPQGKFDEGYLKSLDIYKNNPAMITILDRTLANLDELLKLKPLTYIGTRLHCGIHALNSGVNSLILEVDARAKYIAQDTGLPVCKREDIDSIRRWLDGSDVVALTMPNTLNLWREALRA